MAASAEFSEAGVVAVLVLVVAAAAAAQEVFRGRLAIPIFSLQMALGPIPHGVPLLKGRLADLGGFVFLTAHIYVCIQYASRITAALLFYI